MYLLFDTETSGLPKNWKAPYTDSDNWPRMVSISAQLANSQGKIIREMDRIIKPVGFKIPDDAAKLHGITQERAWDEGILLKDALTEFSELALDALYLVAHNYSFDKNILWAEMYRVYRLVPGRMKAINTVCTMLAATNYCGLPSRSGKGYKWPSLEELHQRLFNESVQDAHTSKGDTNALTRCFFELKEREIIQV